MEWGLNVVMFMEIIIEYMSFFYIIFRKNLCVSFFKKFLILFLSVKENFCFKARAVFCASVKIPALPHFIRDRFNLKDLARFCFPVV